MVSRTICFTFIILALAYESSHVSAAPPPPPSRLTGELEQTQEHQKIAQETKLTSRNVDKTADLTLLINETLRINNKPVENVAVNQSFRNDWTFDRVEYDLIDFLQELNARYRQASKNSSEPATVADHLDGQSQSIAVSLEGKSDILETAGRVNASSIDMPTRQENSSTVEQQADIVPSVKVESSAQAATEAQSSVTPVTSDSSSVLPISLATGDHDISESTWQYGIFDRFTRPRASTTPSPADSLVVSGSSLDVRTFNSDECGLRSYRQEPDYFPQASQLDTDEITKELSQRRQRPPLGSSFFQSHKKFHHTGSDLAAFDRELNRDELENRDKLLPPPFDRYGESANMPADPYNRPNYSSIGDTSPLSGQPDSTYGADSSSTSDSEFNLSSRRQWLQQQLGSTLQMLGYNATNQAALDYFINQTTGAAAASRENMMKMSGNKLGKAMQIATLSSEVAGKPIEGPEISEKELKARQDELKLEARVIGGNDARLGDSPWSVSLQALVSRPGTGGLEYRHYCGGTIISEFYILTAAHCLDFMVGRESRLFVVVGDLNWRMSTASLHGRRFGIEKLIIHGGYKSTAFGHDIGLIRTKESMKPLKVNGRYIINSVCLPERNVEHSGEAELVGWGLFSNRNEMADSLQIAEVPILPRPLCVDLYRRRTGLIQWLIGVELITEKQICAGTFGRGICQGDSGSALVLNEKAPLEGKAALAQRLKAHQVRDAQQRATIIGVVAFGGIRRCSYQSLPGVYMQTSKYLDWILPRIQQ